MVDIREIIREHEVSSEVPQSFMQVYDEVVKDDLLGSSDVIYDFGTFAEMMKGFVLPEGSEHMAPVVFFVDEEAKRRLSRGRMVERPSGKILLGVCIFLFIAGVVGLIGASLFTPAAPSTFDSAYYSWEREYGWTFYAKALSIIFLALGICGAVFLFKRGNKQISNRFKEQLQITEYGLLYYTFCQLDNLDPYWVDDNGYVSRNPGWHELYINLPQADVLYDSRTRCFKFRGEIRTHYYHPAKSQQQVPYAQLEAMETFEISDYFTPSLVDAIAHYARTYRIQ